MVLATEPELQDGQVPMEVLEGRIECRNMSSRSGYGDRDIERGAFAAGPENETWSDELEGESTLAELLLAMYDVPVASWSWMDDPSGNGD